jgi:predicted transcriptional regulator
VRVLTLDPLRDEAQVERVMKALASPNRIRILCHLADRQASVNDIASALELPLSTTAAHVEALEEAGLIHTEFEPASRGLKKVCSRMADQVVLTLPKIDEPHQQAIEQGMPIGAYTDCQVSPTCGLVTESKIIGMLDDPASFYEPHRVDAQLLWFHQGSVEYRFPNRLPSGSVVEALRLSMEICSEAPLYNERWPSDITVWINGVDLGFWTSPGDFGGERGRLTPDWWAPNSTQYGLLKVWHVSERETEVDGMRISGVTIRDLNLGRSPAITVRIGVKPEARYVGGLNLFGSRFGNYPQDLVLRLTYRST